MKILITYAYAGIGHKKAADAVSKALSGFRKAEVQNIDVLDYTNAFFKFSYPRVYLFLINRISCLWGFFYYLLDLKIVDIFIAPLRRFVHGLNAKRFSRFVAETKPDVVISTHFLPSEVVSGMKKKGIFKGRLITIVTDFLPHSFWMAHESDYFIAALERTKKDLLRRGVEEKKIKVMGIPCDRIFSIPKDRRELLQELGLEKGLFNLLIMGGGFGTGPVKEIVNAVSGEAELQDKVQIMIICGKNKPLLDYFTRLKKDLKIKIHAFGYMNNVDEFMEISDCIITKSGGLTVSEALSKKLPMIIIKPIPGQETRNCSILAGYGTAVRADNAREAKDIVADFVKYPEKTLGMRARIKLLAYPDAAVDIAEFVMSYENKTD